MKTIEKLSVKIGIEIMEKYSTTIDYTPMFEDAAMRMAEELERFIPIEEELPKIDENVLIKRAKPYHINELTAFQRGGIFFSNETGEILTHVIEWRPINHK